MATSPTKNRSRRLDQPREGRRSMRPSYDSETFGALSERIARYIGSWRFIAWMTGFIICWVLWNIFAPDNLKVDPYPFIFLTLLLSLQASYAAPLILLAQNRQADRDRVQYQDDRGSTDLLIADTEYVSREIASLRAGLGDMVTRDYLRAELRTELRLLLAQIEHRDTASEVEAARRAKDERKKRERKQRRQARSGAPEDPA